MDPYREISRTPGCEIHASKSKLQSYTLSSVYMFVKGEKLIGAHCNLVNAKAQTSIVLLSLDENIPNTYVTAFFFLQTLLNMGLKTIDVCAFALTRLQWAPINFSLFTNMYR